MYYKMIHGPTNVKLAVVPYRNIKVQSQPADSVSLRSIFMSRVAQIHNDTHSSNQSFFISLASSEPLCVIVLKYEYITYIHCCRTLPTKCLAFLRHTDKVACSYISTCGDFL